LKVWWEDVGRYYFAIVKRLAKKEFQKLIPGSLSYAAIRMQIIFFHDILISGKL